MEPEPPALGAQSLSHWTAREGPVSFVWWTHGLAFSLRAVGCKDSPSRSKASLKLQLSGMSTGNQRKPRTTERGEEAGGTEEAVA